MWITSAVDGDEKQVRTGYLVLDQRPAPACPPRSRHHSDLIGCGEAEPIRPSRGRIDTVTSPEIQSVPADALPGEFDTAAPATADDAGGAILLDVREDDEWELGHAPGAVHIPMSDVPARIDELNHDAQIYVVCRQGGRSLQVARYLAHAGFDVYQVTGGMVAWQKSGRPLAAAGDQQATIY
jgi:rhodanese-related sulfurtransferase